MKDVRFIYFRRNGGTITVAYTIVNRHEKHGVYHVVFDYASCSPKDRFDKKIGKNMALGRLAKRMKNLISYDYIDGYSDLTFMDNPNQGLYKQTVEHIERRLFYSGEYQVPNWYKKKTATFPNTKDQNVKMAVRSLANVGVLNKAEADALKRIIDSRTYNFI